MLKHSIVGSAERVRKDLESFVTMTEADELMVVTSIHDHIARVRSYEIVAEVCGLSTKA